MTVFWTRARHAELPDVVLPAASVESYPGWEAVGEPSDNVEALRAELEREQIAAASAAPATEVGAAPPSAPTPTLPAPKTGAYAPESSAPAGADPKE